jgi:hypothetical protein
LKDKPGKEAEVEDYLKKLREMEANDNNNEGDPPAPEVGGDESAPSSLSSSPRMVLI